MFIGGNGDCGVLLVLSKVYMYVYVQGMVVEMDKEVWLLLADLLATAPHVRREGAILNFPTCLSEILQLTQLDFHVN